MSDWKWIVATLLASLAGAQSTYTLAHKLKMNSIRAASTSSLVFVAIAYFSKNPLLLSLQPAFFGSTYVSMSEPHRLSEGKVMLAGTLFGVILLILQQSEFVHFHGGIGGTLGGTAFIACILVYWLQYLLLKIRSWR